MKPAALLCIVLLGGCAVPKPVAPAPALAVQPFRGITVRPHAGEVQIEAVACLDEGWLEQIACSPGTREHESLVVVEARPSDVHAALLLAGFQAGTPGRWSDENETVSLVPPQGDALRIFVRYRPRGASTEIEEPIGAWIADESGAPTFPDAPWVFGGSAIVPNPPWMEPGEHYVADMTGSIIGLVTFGDEVIGFKEVLPDQEAVEPPHWQVRSDHVPPVGTKVTLIIRGTN